MTVDVDGSAMRNEIIGDSASRYDLKNMNISEAMRHRLELKRSENLSVVKQYNNDVFGEMKPNQRGMRFRNSTYCLTSANGPSEIVLRSEIVQPVYKPIN